MKWTRHATIGRGSTATVSLATSALSGELFAAKSAELSLSKPLQREQSILSKLSSPYIVNYKGFDLSQELKNDNNDQRIICFYNLFMEYLPRGTLADELRRVGGKLEEPAVRAYTWQILKGLEYLHGNDVVHCDVKPTNLLLSKENVIKISDFGCSKSKSKSSFLDDGGDDDNVFSGTPMYMSPEAVLGQRQGFESDIWSLGCTVVEMATGKKPWPEEAFVGGPFSALYRIGFSGESPEIPCSLSDEGRDFLAKCFERNPSERLSAAELLRHAFFDEQSLGCNDRVLSPSSVFDQSAWNNSLDHSDHGDHGDYNIIIPTVAQRFEIHESVSDWTSLDGQDWITIRSNDYNNNDEIVSTSTSGEFLSLGFHVNTSSSSDNNVISTINVTDHRMRNFVIAFDHECEENDDIDIDIYIDIVTVLRRNLKLLKQGNEDFSSLHYFSDFFFLKFNLIFI